MIFPEESGFTAPYGQTMMQVQQPMHFSVSCVICPVSWSNFIAPAKQAFTHGVSLQFWHLIEIEFGLFVSILTRLIGFGYSFRYALMASLDLECSIVQ